MNLAQSLDASKLLLATSGLSFLLSISSSPSYNLPILLFGFWAHENVENPQPLQTFTSLLGASVLFDIIWVLQNDQNGFGRFLTLILWLLKVPTFFSSALSLRQRGSHFGGNLGIRGNDLSGPTIWSMPGGFTSENRTGYQPFGEPPVPPPVSHTVAPAPQVATPQPSAVPGGYQVV